MIEKVHEETLYELLPTIHEVTEFLEPGEYKRCRVGDILYNTETQELRQYGILELVDNEESIRDTYKELIPLVDEQGEKISNEVFVKKLQGLRQDIEKVSNTAETNNAPAYIKKLKEMIDSGNYSFKEVKSMERKIASIESAMTLTYLRGMHGRIRKFDNKLYKKYKLEATKKLKDNTKYSFPPINDILIILNNINIDNEKENKLFLLNFYKYIVDNKMEEIGVSVYFTLVNILGLVKQNNEFRPYIIENLYKIIKYFNQG